MKKNRSAFTLIEVLVFTSILSIFFVSAASITTMTIKQADLNKKKVIATHYAEELLSMLQGEREIGWDTFVSHAATESKTFCMNGEELEWTTSVCVPPYSLNGFERTVTLRPVGVPVSQMIIKINVKWQEGNNVYQVPLQSVFNLWEQ